MEQSLYELPQGWAWRALQEISSLITDGTLHSPKIQHDEPATGRYKYITSKHVKNDGLRLEGITYIDSEVHREIFARCNPEYGDQLITKDGAMTGTCCLNSLDEPFSILSSVALVKQRRDIVQPDFLNHYLKSPVGQEQLLGDISGAAITRTNLKKLKTVKVPIPSLKEQERIVAKLDALFTRINAAITHLQENLDFSKALFASALDAAFAVLEHRFKLAEIAEVKGGKRLPKGDKLQDEPTSHPYIRVSDFMDDGKIDPAGVKYINDNTYEKIKRYTISSNDLYISIAGTIGKTGIIPSELDGANLTENAAKLVFKQPEMVNARFVYYFTRSHDFLEQAGLATKIVAQPKLALTRLSKIEVPVPALAEQKRIVSVLESLAEHTQPLEAETQERLDQLTALKSSLLDAAFRGQL